MKRYLPLLAFTLAFPIASIYAGNGNGKGPPLKVVKVITPPTCIVVSPEGPKPKSNNGHGNNIDGVDSSNPGKSKQGLDSDPTIDDERK